MQFCALCRILKVEPSSHSRKSNERKMRIMPLSCVNANETKEIFFYFVCNLWIGIPSFFRVWFPCRWQLHGGTREETFFYRNVIVISLLHSMWTQNKNDSTKQSNKYRKRYSFILSAKEILCGIACLRFEVGSLNERKREEAMEWK